MAESRLSRFLPYLLVGNLCALLILLLAQKPSDRYQRRDTCVNNLRNISLAMHAYEQKYGCLPPAYIPDADGKPMHSWRVLLLPYLDHNAIYEEYRFDEPWDGPNNRRFHDKVIPLYRCPSDTSEDQRMTSYSVITGQGTLFDGDKCRNTNDVEDDSGTTLLLIEASDSGIHWMEPRDISLGSIDSESGLTPRSKHPDVIVAAFCNGRVVPIRDDLDPSMLRALITPDGGEKIDRSNLNW
jgi:hypothetical protein